MGRARERLSEESLTLLPIATLPSENAILNFYLQLLAKDGKSAEKSYASERARFTSETMTCSEKLVSRCGKLMDLSHF